MITPIRGVGLPSGGPPHTGPGGVVRQVARGLGPGFAGRGGGYRFGNEREEGRMSTTKQKAAARKNIRKARAAQTKRAKGQKVPKAPGLSTKEQNRLAESEFAFPDERKEPLPDAKHVRNAVARFDQVEGVSDSARDRAWQRIKQAAKQFGVKISETNWRELGRPAKKRAKAKKPKAAKHGKKRRGSKKRAA
jgi:hypothetical protein